jgi:large subunit ribosomal protein L25
MPDTYAAEPRTTLGKRVAKLRRSGVLPANVFGRGMESVAVQIETRAVRDLLRSHGTNTLISLQVAGEDAPRPVVVRDVGRHPVTHIPLHLDFYQVDLSRRISGSVPVVLIGDSSAVKDLGGVLLVVADAVQIEALPADMPSHLEVSIDGLTEFDAEVTVGDLDLPAGVVMLSESDQTLARIARPRGLTAEGAEDEAAGAAEGGEGAVSEAPESAGAAEE